MKKKIKLFILTSFVLIGLFFTNGLMVSADSYNEHIQNLKTFEKAGEKAYDEALPLDETSELGGLLGNYSLNTLLSNGYLTEIPLIPNSEQQYSGKIVIINNEFTGLSYSYQSSPEEYSLIPEKEYGLSKNKDLNVTVESGTFGLFIENDDINNAFNSEHNLNLFTDRIGFSTNLFPFSIQDYRGTNDGWRITLSATPFTEVEPIDGFADGTEAKILENSLYYSSNNDFVVEAIGTNAQNISSDFTFNKYTKELIDNGEEVTIMEAPKGFGSGYNLVKPTMFSKIEFENNVRTTDFIDKINYPNQPTPYTTTISLKIYDTP